LERPIAARNPCWLWLTGLGSKGFLENYGFHAIHSEIRKRLLVERLGGFVKELFRTYLEIIKDLARLAESKGSDMKHLMPI
jgi:hypothetical protein